MSTLDPATALSQQTACRSPVLGVLLLLVGILAVGCQTAGGGSGASPGEAKAWPPPPAKARILWVQEIRTPTDLGIRPNPVSRLWNWLSGKDTPRLVRPYAVSTDSDGRVWVADPGARGVHVFDSARRRYRFLPDKKAPAPLLSPVALAHGPDGETYVADSALGLIRRFDRKGQSLAAWDAEGGLERPTGLVWAPDSGLLWVVDSAKHHLLALNAAGKLERTIGQRGSGLGEFNFPTHVTLDRAGNLLVTDALNFRVQCVTQDGVPLRVIGELGDGPGSLSKPKGVGVDAEDHIYVVDALFDNVQIFDQSGGLLLHFGATGSARGDFWLPAGLHISAAGRIHVADSYNQRIQVFDYLRE